MKKEQFLSREEKTRIIDKLVKIQQVAADFQTVLNHNYESLITAKSESDFYLNFNIEISELSYQIDRLIDGEGGKA